MSEVHQDFFEPVGFDASGFNLHTHKSAPSDTCILFIHGLSGRGYATWGGLPKRLFDGLDGPAFDVGIYDYASGLRRAGFKGANFQFWLQQLGPELKRAVSRYKYVVLLGHSMGGVLAEALAVEFLQDKAMSGGGEEAGDLAAVVLFGAPRAGSAWAKPSLRVFVPDFKYLGRLRDEHAKVDRFLTDYTVCRNVADAPPGQHVLPRFAVVGGSDKFVSRFSSMFGIPSKQVLSLSVGHSAIAKPPDDESVLLDWLHREVIAARIDTLNQNRRQQLHDQQVAASYKSTSASTTLFTEFSSDVFGLDWEEIYVQAVEAASGPDLSIVDVRGMRGIAPNLLIAVHHADRVVARESTVAANMVSVARARERQSDLAVGLSPVGQLFVPAEEILRELTAEMPAGGWFYIRGASDEVALREVLAKFLMLNASSRARRRAYGAESAQISSGLIPTSKLEGDDL